MRELVTMAFRQVRGVRKIILPEDCSPTFLNAIVNLHEMLSVHNPEYLVVEGKKGFFYVRFFEGGWIGVATELDVSDILITAGLERTVKFVKMYRQMEQRIDQVPTDIEQYFITHGVPVTVREISLSMNTDSLCGEIKLSAPEERVRAIKEHMEKFFDRELPYFIKNEVDIVVEKRGLLDRITRDQLMRIIRRVERL